MSKYFIALLFLIIFILSLNSEEYLPFEQESPRSFLEFEIGDKEVDFFLIGSWSFSLLAGTGLLILPDSGVQVLDYFPGMEQGFYFNQVPDLTFSVWFIERYFFNLTYTGDITENQILTGYKGKENELLQHLYVGNSNINISPYSYIEIPETGLSSIGVSSLLKTTSSSHELLLRYDYNTEVKKTFLGSNELIEHRIPIEDYSKGIFFRLPDAGIQNLKVYIQDHLGPQQDLDGRKYRQVTLEDEVVLNSNKGLVSFKEDIFDEAVSGRILVYYTKNGEKVGHTSLGADALAGEDAEGNIDLDIAPAKFDYTITHFALDMAEKKIILNDGTECLLLWEPGIFSPFEISSVYQITESLPDEKWRIKASVVQKGSNIEKTDFPWNIFFKIDSELSRITAYCTNDIRDNFKNLYPFPDPQNILYGPNRLQSSSYTDYEILISILEPVSEFLLEPDIIPGSVGIIRNGIKETRFKVDYTTGILTFLIDIQSQDLIEVTYRKREDVIDNGDLCFGWGNTISIGDQIDLKIATGLRWNLLPGSFTEEVFSRTGEIIGSVSLDYKTNNITLKAGAAISFTNPDTTGILRVAGMESSGMEIELSQEVATPSSVPLSPSGLTISNRGLLYFKNYRKYDIFGGSTLKNINWSNIPEDQILPYSTGSKPGPYEVADIYTLRGSSLVMDFLLSSDKEWTGIQIPITSGDGTLDLSELHSITVSYGTMDISNNDVDIYLQIGEIGEDLDNDNKLDKEYSTTSKGYSFNDTANNAVLLVGGGPKGTGNGIINSEDTDGNMFLDQEVEARLLSISCPAPAAASETITWRNYTYHLNMSDKNKLSRTRSIRILVKRNITSGEINGKVLINRIHLGGSNFWKEITDGDDDNEEINIRETYESLLKDTLPEPDLLIQSTYPEVKNIFHSHGESQKVLEVSWDNFEQDETWKISYPAITDTKTVRYNQIVFYMRIPSLTAGGNEKLTFSLLDFTGKGIKFSFTPEENQAWKEVNVYLDSKKIFIDGIEIDSTFEIDNDYISLNNLFIEISDSEAGLLYIDEIHFKQPEILLGTAATIQGEISFPGIILSINNLPILSDFYFREDSSFLTPGFSSLYGIPETNWALQSLSECSLDLFFFNIDSNMLLQGGEENLYISGGHRIKIPNDSSFFIHILDSYKAVSETESNDFSRMNSIQISPANRIFSTYFYSDAFNLNDILIQNWNISNSFYLPELITVTLTGNYMLSYSNFFYTPDWYLASWLRDYKYILPWSERQESERNEGITFTSELTTKPVGIEFESNLSIKNNNFTELDRDFYSFFEYSLFLPLNFKFNKNTGITLATGYKRTFNFEQTASGTGSVFSDIERWGNDIARHNYIFTNIPLYELFATEFEDTFIDVNNTNDFNLTSYYPELSITLTRNFGSYIYDLFIPSSLDFIMGKEMKKEQDLFNFKNTYTFSSRSNAINLFGKYGVHSLMDFYLIDEYSLSFALILSSLKDGDTEYELLIGNYMGFEGKDKSLFYIENQLRFINDDSFYFSDTGTVGFGWNIYLDNGISLPFLDKESIQKSYFLNNENLKFSIKEDPGADSFHMLNLILGHTTSLEYPGVGFIRAGVSIGFDIENIDNGNTFDHAYRIGLKGGIEAELKF